MQNLYKALQLKQLYQLKNLGYKYTTTQPFPHQKEEIKLTSIDNLNELKKQLNNCHLCPLSKSRTKIVFSKGDSNADIMFIGDYPTSIENDKGEIFIGKSGEMIKNMIEKVLNIPQEKVYITNILKCYLPINYELKESYIDSCKSYITKEIELIKPKIIITLGEIAYQHICSEFHKLKDIRGNIIQKENYKIIPTYHPNFLLKNPSLKKEVFKDLKKVKSLI
jgi:DNA polymerase